MSIKRTRRGICYGIIRDGAVMVFVLHPTQDTTTKEAA